MKKLLFILLTITLFLPLYAQEAEPESESDEDIVEFLNEDELLAEGEEELPPEEAKEPFNWVRQKFEFGGNIRVGFDNSLISTSEFFKKNLVIDLNKIQNSIRDGGLNVNAGGDGNILYLDILNINIKEGLWDFGFFINAEGNINVNVPKSLFTLITEGNINQRLFEGMLSAAGGIYANTGLSASAKYGKLRVGLKPTLFTPLIFIPRSGITYRLETTEKDVDLTSSGEINIYSPLGKDGQFAGLQFGFDVSLDGEYALFPFLDVGGSLARIPFAPATLRNRMKLGMSELHYHLDGESILGGEMEEMPDLGKFDDPVYDTEPRKVYRPFRFDVHARYKPFLTDILVVRPNIGFSVDGNEKQGYFNAGIEVQSTLVNNMIKLYLGTGYQESIWRHRLGAAFNFRAFELGLEGALRADSFPGSFRGQGFAVGLSSRFGW